MGQQTANTPQAEEPSQARILVADDDNLMQAMIGNTLARRGHDVTVVKDGRDAVSAIRREANRLDVILLDRQMPGRSGLEILRDLQADPQLRHIPVIMQTSADSPAEIREGIEAGVFYYLTKPFTPEMLETVVAAAVRNTRRCQQLQREAAKHRSGFSLVEQARCALSSMDDAGDLAGFAANFFPAPEQVVGGLYELIANAQEHGNLGIGYEEKRQLLMQGKWRDEVFRRECMAENAKKSVHVLIERQGDRIQVTIADEGKGFDWKSWSSLDPQHATGGNGRGVAQAISCFDEVAFNEAGNSVTVSVKAL